MSTNLIDRVPCIGHNYRTADGMPVRVGYNGAVVHPDGLVRVTGTEILLDGSQRVSFSVRRGGQKVASNCFLPIHDFMRFFVEAP